MNKMNKIFKNIFRENLTIKIISIALALFLWFFVTFKGQTETSLDIPLEFKNTPSDMEVFKQTVKKISVSISARERILREINHNDIRAIVDISNIKVGENSIPITKSSIKIPRGIEILRIDPSTVKLVVDKKEQKTIPVKPVLTGKPSKGFIISEIEVNPSLIRIEGAQKELDRIRLIKTEPIDVDGISESITVHVKIDPEGKIFRTDKDIVYVKIKVRRR